MQRSNVRKSVCRKKAIKSVQQKVKTSCAGAGFEPVLVTQQLQGVYSVVLQLNFLPTPSSSTACNGQTKAVRSLQ